MEYMCDLPRHFIGFRVECVAVPALTGMAQGLGFKASGLGLTL